jgi:hypothetical protein
VDRSFEGLLFSVILHGLLLWLFIMGKFSPPVLHQDKTEITIIEKPARAFVTETEDLKPVLEDLKDKVDLLSKYTKRVQKQTKAAKSGPTLNAIPKPVFNLSPPKPQRVAGHNPRPRDDEGVGRPLQPGAQNQPIRNMAIGSSSVAEYIPGVQEGAFTALNTDQFTYYAFFSRMNEQVRNRWISMIRSYVDSLSPQHLSVLSKYERHSLVEIILSQDGSFENALLFQSSGDDSLDKIHGRSFQIAAPFPHPPKGLVESDGKIHLKYEFVLQFRPPSLGPGEN